MGLTDFLKSKGVNVLEGHSQQCKKEIEELQKISSKKNIRNILEIGFNAGHSAEIFLSSNPECNVLSVDIGNHDYLPIGKKYIDLAFPGRHELLIGDSTKIIPNFDTNTKYDLIFIDGGHSFKIAFADIINCQKLADNNTIVIMDDTVYKEEWAKKYTEGPTKAWTKAVNENIIVDISRIDFNIGRGISIGKYNFK